MWTHSAFGCEKKNGIIKTLSHSKYKLLNQITLKEDVMLCVSELADDVGDASEHESSDWTHLLDRSGGLQYVNDMTYRLMGAVEICVRNVFTTKGLHQTDDLNNQPKPLSKRARVLVKNWQ